MRTALRHGVASIFSLLALFSASSAAADYSVVTTWNQKFTELTKATEVANTSTNLYGSSFGFDIPADFTFRFYGENLKVLNASGSGALSFSKGEYIPTDNYALPYAGTPSGMIAGWWDYWFRNYYGADPYEGGINYKIEGTGDKQVLKIEWKMMPYYLCYAYSTGYTYTCDNTKHFTWQVWIYESNGVDDSIIQFHYQPIYIPDGCSGNCLNYYVMNGYDYAPYNEISGTIGVENRARNQASYGLACKNNCQQKDWPGNKVIMFGQPSGPELLPTMTVKSLITDDVNTTLTTSTSLRNIGSQAATGVTFSYYLSADDKLDPAKDLLFATHDPVFDVAPNTTAAYDDEFVQPRPDPGWYHVCMRADPDAAADEAFEENNDLCAPDKWIVGVDFLASITVPGTAGPGDDMPIDFTLTNVGYQPTAVNYRILLSADDKPSTEDIELFATGEPLPLQGQETYSVNQLNLFIPSDALGTHENEVPRYVLVQLDPADEVLEADEKNNVRVSTPVLLIKADLRVDAVDLQLPDGCYFGRPATVTLDLSNNGAARARAYDNALVISDNGVITAYDQAVRLSPAFCTEDSDCVGTLGTGSYCLTDSSSCTKDCTANSDCVNDLFDSEGLSCLKSSGVDVGQCSNVLPGYDSTRVTFSGILPVTDPNGAPLLDGTWYFGAVTDFYDQVNEGNESNNARPTGAGIDCHSPAPDFLPSSMKLPARGAAGEQLTIRRSIRNRGNLEGTVSWRYFLSSNPIVSANDIALSFASTPSGTITIDADRTDEATDVVQLPSSLVAGKYYLGIVLDPTNTVAELREDNNVLVSSETIDVQASALRIATSALPPATIQVTYARQLVATGGAGAYGWTSTSPALPPGMRLQSDGLLTGKPAEVGSYVFGVRVQSGGSFADGLLYVAVLPATGPLAVSTDRLPSAYVDVPYRVELAAVGGSPPYQWSIIGRLPQGLSLKNNTITGTAEIADGTSDPRTFKVQVKDARGTTSERELSLPVLRSADLSIQTTRIQDGLVGQPYQQIIRAAGGEPPYEFTITGIDNTGLTSNSNSDTTALISGIPEASGYFEMVVTVKDVSQQTATQTFKFAVIGQAIQVQTDRALPVAKAGELYPETQLIAGTPDVAWEIFSGELPGGIALSSTGVLSGTVDKAVSPRTYTFLTRAFDEKGGEGFGSFSILIDAGKIEPKYTVTKTGCGNNAAGGSPTAFLLPVLGAALLLLRRRR